MTRSGPRCPVCHESVSLTPVRDQVKAHSSDTGSRCAGSGQRPVLGNVPWWRGITGRRLARAVSFAIFTVLAGTLGILSFFGLEPDSVASKATAGKEQDGDSARPLGISAAISDERYRIILPVANTAATEQQLNELTVLVTFRGPVCAEVPEKLVYEVQAPVTVDSSGTISQGSVSVDSSLAAGFTVPAGGQLIFGCGLDQVELNFLPPGALLARASTTPVVIDVPRHLDVSSMLQGYPGFETSGAELPNIGDPAEVQYVAFRVIARTSDGASASSCYLVTGSDSSLEPGARNCDSEVEGMPVFWRKVFDPDRGGIAFEKLD